MGDASGNTRAHCRWELGYQLWYTGYRHRVFDAIGQSVNKFEITRNSPLVGAAGTDPYWATTTMKESGAGTTEVAATNTAGVAFRVTTAGGALDGANIQASGAAFTLTSNKPFYFGAKVAINHATSTDFYIGLCHTRTVIINSAAHALHASTKSHVGFYKYDAGTATKYISEKSGSASSSSAGTMTTSAHVYEMVWDGTKMNYWLDGSAVGTVTTAAKLPTTASLRPSLCFRNGNSAARQCDVYWWRCVQIGQ